MARLLNAIGYVSSVLATVCLILALIAAPIGEVQADEPVAIIGGGAAIIAASCPNPTHNPCPINNTNQVGCPGVGCSIPGATCWCIWNGNAPISQRCYCP